MGTSPAKRWKVALWSFVATCLGIIPGLGLPGAYMLTIGAILLLPLGLIFPALNAATWPSHAAWPAAILLTFTLFPFLILAHEIAFRRLRRFPLWKRCAAWLGISVAWSVVGCMIVATMIAYEA